MLIIGYDKVNVHLTGYEESDEWINNFIENHFNGSLSITSAFLFRSNKKVLILEVIKSETLQPFKNEFYQIVNKSIEEFKPHNNQNYNYQASEQNNAASLSNPIKEEPLLTPNNNELPINNSINQYQNQNNDLNQISQTRTEEMTPQNTIQLKQQHLNEVPKKPELNRRQTEALKYVDDKGSIKNKQYRKLFDVSHKTAHIELAELVTKNELHISGSGRSTCYVKMLQNPKQETRQLTQREQLLYSYLNTKKQISETMYADEFNIDLAQAINELKEFCDQGILEKTIIENEVLYIKRELAYI